MALCLSQSLIIDTSIGGEALFECGPNIVGNLIVSLLGNNLINFANNQGVDVTVQLSSTISLIRPAPPDPRYSVFGNNLIMNVNGSLYVAAFKSVNNVLVSMIIVAAIDPRIKCIMIKTSLPLVSNTFDAGCNTVATFDSYTNNILDYSITGNSVINIGSGELQIQPILKINSTIPTGDQAIVVNDLFIRNVGTDRIYGLVFNQGRNAVRSIFISTTSDLSGPLPGPAVPNQNFCISPVIEITNLQTSTTTNDILEVDIRVQNGCVYDVVSRCYQSCSQIIEGGTLFIIFGLFVNCTLVRKITDPNVRNRVLLYAVLKLTLARLIIRCEDGGDKSSKNRDKKGKNKSKECVKCSGCSNQCDCDCNFEGDYDIKWLLRDNYLTLYNAILHSRYCQFIPILDDNVELEEFFKSNCH